MKGAGECGKTGSVARRDGGALDRVLMRPDRVFLDRKMSVHLGASHQAASQNSTEGGTTPKKHAPDNQKHDPVRAPEGYANYTRGAVHQSYLFGCRCRVYLMAIKAVTPWNFEGISSGSHCCRTPPPRHTNQLHRCHKNTIPSQTTPSRHLPRDRSVFSP